MVDFYDKTMNKYNELVPYLFPQLIQLYQKISF